MSYSSPMRTALLAILVATGCHDAAKDIEKLADRACECQDKKDKACAEKVVDDFVDYVKANQNAKGDEEKAAKEFGRMMECTTKAGVDMAAIAGKMKAVQDLDKK